MSIAIKKIAIFKSLLLKPKTTTIKPKTTKFTLVNETLSLFRFLVRALPHP